MKIRYAGFFLFSTSDVIVMVTCVFKTIVYLHYINGDY